MRKLFETTAVMGISTIAAIVIGLIRAKFLAMTLGPSGVGIFAQAITFFQSAEAICGLGIGLGITKYVSQAWQSQNLGEVRKVVSVSFILQAATFLIFFISTLIFSERISQFVFSSTAYSGFLVIIAGAVLFSTLLVSLESTLLGLRKPEVFSKARVIYYLAGLAILVLFVGAMKLPGGFIYIFINSAVSFLIVGMLLTHALKCKIRISMPNIIKKLKSLDFKSHSGKLLTYGLVTLGSVALTWLTILYVRSILIKEAGAQANGFYQVVFALVGYYSPFFTNGIWGYLFPKLSAINDVSQFNMEANKAFRFILIFLIPAIAVLFLLRRAFVLIVFSREFLPALEIFPLYLLGSLFFMISYILGTSLLARKQLKVYFSINVFQNAGYALLFVILVRNIGVMAIAVSYLAINMCTSMISVIYQVTRMGLMFDIQNIKLFITGFIFIITVFFIPIKAAPGLIFKGLLVASWFLFAMGKRERALLKSFVRVR